MNRTQIADLIAARLKAEQARLHEAFTAGAGVQAAWLDDLLPPDIPAAIYEHMPPSNRMMARRSIKEHKLVAVQMDRYHPLLEEAVYAFQAPEVVRLIGEITGLKGLEPDTELYAGGVSMMAKGGYLRPHIDNSHDRRAERYRVLNLLYYVTPGWREEYGGSLQLWDDGPHTTPRTVPALFNRLVIMATHERSWHSVNEIVFDGRRCCVSNYYFSKTSPAAQDYFHATSFRGERPGLDDLVMQADNSLRTSILKAAPGTYKNPHRYKKDG